MSRRTATSQAAASCPRDEDSACPRDSGAAADAAFDSVYPPAIRAISRRFWTPVAVARRAAQLFRQAGARSVADIGSGVGKFVLVAAAAAPEVCFVGIEQREHLVAAARRAQARLRVPNAFFLAGEATKVPGLGFDGLYFFNPFAENLFVDGDQIDDAVELGESRFFRDVLRTEHALRAARLGTAIVTYHGMGGRMPACYELSECERAGSDWLRLWVKTRDRAEGFFLELGDRVILHRANGAPA
jgi:SAM-dependent methyltransferase